MKFDLMSFLNSSQEGFLKILNINKADNLLQHSKPGNFISQLNCSILLYGMWDYLQLSNFWVHVKSTGQNVFYAAIMSQRILAQHFSSVKFFAKASWVLLNGFKPSIKCGPFLWTVLVASYNCAFKHYMN